MLFLEHEKKSSRNYVSLFIKYSDSDFFGNRIHHLMHAINAYCTR